jgi:hypothetical protein
MMLLLSQKSPAMLGLSAEWLKQTSCIREKKDTWKLNVALL